MVLELKCCSNLSSDIQLSTLMQFVIPTSTAYSFVRILVILCYHIQILIPDACFIFKKTKQHLLRIYQGPHASSIAQYGVRTSSTNCTALDKSCMKKWEINSDRKVCFLMRCIMKEPLKWVILPFLFKELEFCVLIIIRINFVSINFVSIKVNDLRPYLFFDALNLHVQYSIVQSSGSASVFDGHTSRQWPTSMSRNLADNLVGSTNYRLANLSADWDHTKFRKCPTRNV